MICSNLKVILGSMSKAFAMEKVESNSKLKTIIKTKPKSKEELKQLYETLKHEFLEKYLHDEPSLSTERLDEFQFLTILGQGAFGVVVRRRLLSCNWFIQNFSLLPPP
jgi:hypothetical protein